MQMYDACLAGDQSRYPGMGTQTDQLGSGCPGNSEQISGNCIKAEAFNSKSDLFYSFFKC